MPQLVLKPLKRVQGVIRSMNLDPKKAWCVSGLRLVTLSFTNGSIAHIDHDFMKQNSIITNGVQIIWHCHNGGLSISSFKDDIRDVTFNVDVEELKIIPERPDDYVEMITLVDGTQITFDALDFTPNHTLNKVLEVMGKSDVGISKYVINSRNNVGGDFSKPILLINPDETRCANIHRGHILSIHLRDGGTVPVTINNIMDYNIKLAQNYNESKYRFTGMHTVTAISTEITFDEN